LLVWFLHENDNFSARNVGTPLLRVDPSALQKVSHKEGLYDWLNLFAASLVQDVERGEAEIVKT
jgi:hypothetical protein